MPNSCSSIGSTSGSVSSRGHCHGPPLRQAARWLGCCGVHHRTGRVAGLVDRRSERSEGHTAQRPDAGLLGGEVHRRGRHARHLQQRLLDPRDAGGAGHPVDLQLDTMRRHVVAGPAHGCGHSRHQGVARHPVPGADRRLLGGQVDGGALHAGQRRERLLDAQYTGRAGHAFDRQFEVQRGRCACEGAHGIGPSGPYRVRSRLMPQELQPSHHGNVNRLRCRSRPAGEVLWMAGLTFPRGQA
jgi:hypothetical protein